MSTTGQYTRARTSLATRRERLVLGVLLAVLAGLVVLNVRLRPLPDPLLVSAPRLMRITTDQGPELELLRRFAEEHGVETRLVLTETPEEALELLEQGKVHVALAMGVAPLDDPPPGHQLIPTDKKAARRVAYGPQYDEQPIYVVDWDEGYAPPQFAHAALDELLRVAHSFSQDPAQAPALPLDALLLLVPFLPEVRDSAPTGQDAAYRFAWRKDIPPLDKAMRAFWERIGADGSLAEVLTRSLDHLPDDPDPVEMELLRRTLVKNATPLAQAIRRAARKAQVDPFLLMAIIHQESHFNPAAVSATGVRGLMQMTGTTLEHLGVQDPEDHAEVIGAGARYLADLRKGYTELGYGEEDAMMLALYAFNVGQGHVQDAIELARDEKRPLPGWLAVRQTLPLLARLEIASTTRYGLCRGYEAVDFADKVRYFAYAIKGLVLVSGTQHKELAGLGLALAR